ncbi:ATP-dependent endonuclease [Acinetobacter sp. c2-A9]|uniref:ATP-dependent nuclease n=1 Tax=Acinetobacter sp. c2-A9 TaxID=3342802 RepID=UPI0035BB5E23
MLTQLHIYEYRKLKDLSLDFKPTVNLISGTNGTCKSSILHIVGNSFQAFTKNSQGIDIESLSIINAINKLTNPKIENLTKGDKQYNDPAPNQSGILLKLEYEGNSYSFRRHNTRNDNGSRFALKLKYPVGQKQTLPYGMVIYLGLSRIIPIGELSGETKKIRKSLPDKYSQELNRLYYELTGIKINESTIEDSNSLKHRLDFTSTTKVVDSNTISAGEDNLIIILSALISLKYHFDTCTNPVFKKSVLLIDELDSTLHPSLQYKLLKILKEFSENYNIQLFATTHSLYLLDKAFKESLNVIYLKKTAGDLVDKLNDPNRYKIEMQLNSETRQDIYMDKKIPIFTEDAEAKLMTQLIFNEIAKDDESFSSILIFLHYVEMKAGCDNLKSLFKDKVFRSSTFKAICILDADSQTNDISNHIISLPSEKRAEDSCPMSPEKLVFYHLNNLVCFQTNNDFWNNPSVVENGYNRPLSKM